MTTIISNEEQSGSSVKNKISKYKNKIIMVSSVTFLLIVPFGLPIIASYLGAKSLIRRFRK